MTAAVKLSQLLIFTKQFSAMIASQLQLVYVLENLAKETPHRRMRQTLDDVLDDVLNGVDLGDALAQFPKVFSDVYVNVVRAGMQSGQLGNALAQMAEYLESADAMSRKIRGALTYPMFLLVAFIVVFNVQVLLILPRFEEMFANFDEELPAPTLFMLAAGKFYVQNWPYLLGVIVAVTIGFIAWTSSDDGRRIWDKLKLQVPVIGRTLRLGALSRFLRTLAVQVHNMVPLVTALRLSASASGNRFIEETIFTIADDVELGVGIAESFRRHDIFTGIVQQMIASGEQASELDELLMSAAVYFDSLLNDQVQTMTELINPVLTIVIGLAIAGMMVAAFLPVFQISGAIA